MLAWTRLNLTGWMCYRVDCIYISEQERRDLEACRQLQGLAKCLVAVWRLRDVYTDVATGSLAVNLVKLSVFICWLSLAWTNVKGGR